MYPSAVTAKALPEVRAHPEQAHWTLLLLLSPFLLLLAGCAGVSWPVIVVAGLAELGFLFWRAERRGGLQMIGPLFFYDLVRLARRGRTTLLRCVYALFLLGALYLVYAEYFPRHDFLHQPFDAGLRISLTLQGKFTREFVTAILALQGAAVLVLTPVYVGGAIAEEKERRTLELLFTSHLHDREIILGKLFGRVGHLAIVLLTGLPILMLVQLFGGVDVALITGGFAATGLSLLSVGGISILCSVLARRVITAVLSSYAACLAFSICCLCFPMGYVSSPIAFVYTLSHALSNGDAGPGLASTAWWIPAWSSVPAPVDTVLGMLSLYGVVHGLTAILTAGLAISGVRSCGVPTGDRSLAEAINRVPVAPLLEDAQPKGESQPSAEPVILFDPGGDSDTQRKPVRARRAYNPPPIGDQPLLWKEVYHRAVISPLVPDPVRELVRILCVIGLLLPAAWVGVLFIAYLAKPWVAYRGVGNWFDPVFRGTFVFFALIWGICVAFRASSSVSNEREGGTLDTLFTLPVDRRTILGAKWLGSILRYSTVGSLLLLVWVMAMLTGAFHPLGALLLALALAVHIAFLASLGVWLSLACRNTLWANLTMALMLLLAFAAPSLLSAGEGGDPKDLDWSGRFFDLALNPVSTWWTLGYSWEGAGGIWGPLDARFLVTLGAALAGVAVYAFLAGALWLLACRRIRSESATFRASGD
jgi:ABC-type transport system involved in multi-copper enzyme maturation permease subunit